MYYTLPIKINNRRLHSCTLRQVPDYHFPKNTVSAQQKEKEVTSNSSQELSTSTKQSEEQATGVVKEVPYTFVIPGLPNESSTLFTINNPRGKKILQCSRGHQDDKRVDTSYYFASYVDLQDNCQVLEIHLSAHNGIPNLKQTITAKVERSNPVYIIESKRLQIQETGLSLRSSIGNGIRQYLAEITPKLDQESQTIKVFLFYHSKESMCYRYEFHLFVTNAMYDGYKMAVDFGSDASQAAYSKLSPQEDDSLMQINLIEQLRGAKYYNDQKVGLNSVDQFDGIENPSLLKSVFYIDSSKKLNEIPTCEKPSIQNPIRIFSYPRQQNKDKTDSVEPPQLKKNELHINKQSEVASEEERQIAKEQNTMKLLPNAKLGEFSDRSLFDLRIADSSFSEKPLRRKIRRSLLNQILHLCFNQLCQDRAKQQQNVQATKIGIQLYLLVPNLYYQRQVYQLIRDTNSDAQEIIKNDPNFRNLIGGIEVLTISESDASFKGYVANALAVDDKEFLYQSSTENLRYLIVDAGKGTFDFSILESYGTSHQHFRSIYKSSIPASGQYLTFQCFAAISDFYQLSITNLVWLFQNADTSQAIELLKRIELYKLNNHIDLYRGGNYNDLNNFTNMDSGDIQSLQTLISAIKEKNIGQLRKISKKIGALSDEEERNFTVDIRDTLTLLQGLLKPVEDKEVIIPDAFGHMHQALNNLTREFGNHIENAGIPNLKFHRVIFTGRAFLYPPFANALVKYLFHSEHPWLDENDVNQSRVLFDKKNAKRVCIMGALTNNCYINSNSDLAGALIKKTTGDYSKIQKIGLWLADGFRAVNIPRPNDFQRITTTFKLDEEFYQGLSIDNDYFPNSSDEFFIGNFPYQIGDRDDKKIFEEDINQMMYLRIDVEQSGYVIRFPKDRDLLRFSFRKHGDKYDNFLIQSLFTNISEQYLSELVSFGSNDFSSKIPLEYRYQKNRPTAAEADREVKNVDPLSELANSARTTNQSPEEVEADIFEDSTNSTYPGSIKVDIKSITAPDKNTDIDDDFDEL